MSNNFINSTGKTITPYSTITTSDNTTSKNNIILCNASSTAITFTLQNADRIAGNEYTIKDISGQALDYPISIVAESGNIDGTTDPILLDVSYGVIKIISNGSAWWVTQPTNRMNTLESKSLYMFETVTTNKTLTSAHTNYFFLCNGTTITFTLPNPNAIPNGWKNYFKNSTSSLVTLQPPGGVMIDGFASIVLGLNDCFQITSNGTNYFLNSEYTP